MLYKINLPTLKPICQINIQYFSMICPQEHNLLSKVYSASILSIIFFWFSVLIEEEARQS